MMAGDGTPEQPDPTAKANGFGGRETPKEKTEASKSMETQCT